MLKRELWFGWLRLSPLADAGGGFGSIGPGHDAVLWAGRRQRIPFL